MDVKMNSHKKCIIFVAVEVERERETVNMKLN